MEFLTLPIIIVVVAIVLISALLKRYRRCPSDKVLVIYGTTSNGGSKGLMGGDRIQATMVFEKII